MRKLAKALGLTATAAAMVFTTNTAYAGARIFVIGG
jgi:hypothetical protein